MKYHLVLSGKTPSKKNGRRGFVRNGRMMNFPSKNYTQWHKDVSLELLQYRHLIKEPISACAVTLTIFGGDKRLFDLTNKAESVMDALVDNNFLVDDNWSCVPRVTIVFGGIDKEHPRAEVDIDVVERL